MTKRLRGHKKAAAKKPQPTPIEPCYVCIGKRIQEVRVTTGLTQREVGAQVGWTRASVANLEAGRRRVMLHDLPRFAKALSITVVTFLDPSFFE
jgi:transcriptional regulator with XRE-family HTH domain